jgi:hypothetical protein
MDTGSGESVDIDVIKSRVLLSGNDSGICSSIVMYDIQLHFRPVANFVIWHFVAPTLAELS